MGISFQPTALGDKRETSLEQGGRYQSPFVPSPPYTLSTGGGAPLGAIFLNGKPVMLNGKYLTLTRAA